MKLTNTKKNKGMTLIELTVVILVLLSLISVLFIGARAWMRGSDRANAALLIRNAQQGVRSHCNILGVDTPAATVTAGVTWNAANSFDDTAAASATNVDPGLLKEQVFGPGLYVETTAAGTEPDHPQATNSFTSTLGFETIPPLGALYMTSTTDAAFFAPKGVQ